MDIKKCQGMTNNLLYLTTNITYIIFSIYLCAKFQVNHKKSHLRAAKYIFRYLKGMTILIL